MANKNLEKYIERIDNVMSAFARSFSAFSKKGLSGIDITLAQMHVLQIIASKDNCKMTDLGKALGVTLGNMTGMIDRLIREKLVMRSSDPDDRRIIRISLTKKGRNVIETICQHKRKNLSLVLQQIPDRDKETLLKIMEKVASVINPAVNM